MKIYHYALLILIVLESIAFAVGDVNNNGAVDLTDAVLSLQVCAGIAQSAVNTSADVNTDGKIGLEEVIYVLQKVSTPDTVYYLDAVSGDDVTGSGKENAPWQTVSKVIPMLDDGVIVVLRNGNYGNLVLNNLAFAHWVTFKADSGHSPEFEKIDIFHTTKQNTYLRFDGLTVRRPDPGYAVDNPASWNPGRDYECVEIENANYVQLINCVITGPNRYLARRGIRAQDADYIKVSHCEINNQRDGPLFNTCSHVEASYNHIHHCGGGSGIKTLPGAVHSDTTDIVIENNHIHDMKGIYSEPFYPPDIIRDGDLHLGSTSSAPPQFDANDIIQQDTTGASGTILDIIWNTDYNCWQLYILPSTGAGSFRSGYVCTASISNLIFTPSYAREGYHAGTGIALRTRNTIVRKNIIHDRDAQGIMFYQDDGATIYQYENMTIENNLVYDLGGYGNRFLNITGPCIIRNNTFVGHVRMLDYSQAYNVPSRYDGQPFSVGFFDGFNGQGVEIYNNITVGEWNLPENGDGTFDGLEYTENYNIWSRRYSSAYNIPGYFRYLRYGKGPQSFIANWYISGDGMHGYPELFENIQQYDGNGDASDYGPFIRWTAEWPAGSVHAPFFVNPGYFTRRVANFTYHPDSGQDWDYHLPPGSLAVNFGDPDHQPDSSLGSIDADGFILDDGMFRDAEHHSAGCYEYSP